MADLQVFNLTSSPITLVGFPHITVPASPNPPSRGEGFNVTSELRGLSGPEYAALEAQRTGVLEYEWEGTPLYSTSPLVAPQTGGGGGSGAVVSTLAALASLSAQDGSSATVLSNRSLWQYLPGSTLTPDGSTVIAAVGGGNWERYFLGLPEFWARDKWYIDPVSGDDEASGDLATPLKSWREFYYRMGGFAPSYRNIDGTNSGIHVKFLTPPDSTIVGSFRAIPGEILVAMRLQGSFVQTGDTATILNVTHRNPATNEHTVIQTVDPLPPSLQPGMLIRFPNAISVWPFGDVLAWVTQLLAGDTFSVGVWLQDVYDADNVNVPNVFDYPGIGSTFEVVDLPSAVVLLDGDMNANSSNYACIVASHFKLDASPRNQTADTFNLCKIVNNTNSAKRRPVAYVGSYLYNFDDVVGTPCTFTFSVLDTDIIVYSSRVIVGNDCTINYGLGVVSGELIVQGAELTQWGQLLAGDGGALYLNGELFGDTLASSSVFIANGGRMNAIAFNNNTVPGQELDIDGLTALMPPPDQGTGTWSAAAPCTSIAEVRAAPFNGFVMNYATGSSVRA